jgi:hypothetical protein
MSAKKHLTHGAVAALIGLSSLALTGSALAAGAYNGDAPDNAAANSLSYNSSGNGAHGADAARGSPPNYSQNGDSLKSHAGSKTHRNTRRGNPNVGVNNNARGGAYDTTGNDNPSVVTTGTPPNYSQNGKSQQSHGNNKSNNQARNNYRQGNSNSRANANGPGAAWSGPSQSSTYGHSGSHSANGR